LIDLFGSNVLFSIFKMAATTILDFRIWGCDPVYITVVDEHFIMVISLTFEEIVFYSDVTSSTAIEKNAISYNST
jgi:hypothetical protein